MGERRPGVTWVRRWRLRCGAGEQADGQRWHGGSDGAMETQPFVPVTGGGSVVVEQCALRGRSGSVIDRGAVLVVAGVMRVVVFRVVTVSVAVVVLEQLGDRVGIVGVRVRPRAAGVLMVEQGRGREGDRQCKQPGDHRAEVGKLYADASHDDNRPLITTPLTWLYTSANAGWIGVAPALRAGGGPQGAP